MLSDSLINMCYLVPTFIMLSGAYDNDNEFFLFNIIINLYNVVCACI